MMPGLRRDHAPAATTASTATPGGAGKRPRLAGVPVGFSACWQTTLMV